MFSTPFTFLNQVGGAQWTPASFSNLYDWWTSDSGVSISSGAVNSWTGYNGNILYPWNSSYKASYSVSDSDWGNKPSIMLNPTLQNSDVGYYINFASAPSITDKTIIGISKLVNKSAADSAIIQYGNSTTGGLRAGIFGLAGSNQYYIYQQIGPSELATVGNTWINGNYQFVRFSYKVTGDTDFYISDTNNISNYVGTIPSPSNYQFGSGAGIGFYANQYGYTSKMTFVEYIIIDGIPNTQELIDFENYIDSKYQFS